jgi:hypothetical protein
LCFSGTWLSDFHVILCLEHKESTDDILCLVSTQVCCSHSCIQTDNVQRCTGICIQLRMNTLHWMHCLIEAL